MNRASPVTIILVLVLVFSSLARLVPAILTGNVFSNDAWPLVELTGAVVRDGRIPIDGGPLRHHVKWPASITFSSVFSLVTGLVYPLFYKYVGVAIVSIALTLLAYTLAFRVVRNSFASLIGAWGLTLLPSFTLFTSAFLKETFAHTILLLCFNFLAGTRNRLHLVPLAILYASLVVSHPLTSLMFIAFLASYMLVSLAYSLKVRGHTGLYVLREYVPAVGVAVAMYGLYSAVYAEIPATLELNDILALAGYAIATYSSLILLPGATMIALSLLLAISAGVYLFKTVSAPFSGLTLLFLIALTVPVVAMFKGNRDPVLLKHRAYITATWLPTATTTLYVATRATFLAGLIHRFANYLAYTVALSLAALALRHKRLAALFAVLLSAVTLACAVTSAVGLQPFMYYWRYSKEDLLVANLATLVEANTTIEGDPRYIYLASSMKPLTPVTVLDPCRSKVFVVFSSENFLYGIPITPVDYVKLRGNHLACKSLVFASKRVLLLGVSP